MDEILKKEECIRDLRYVLKEILRSPRNSDRWIKLAEDTLKEYPDKDERKN